MYALDYLGFEIRCQHFNMLSSLHVTTLRANHSRVVGVIFLRVQPRYREVIQSPELQSLNHFVKTGLS